MLNISKFFIASAASVAFLTIMLVSTTPSRGQNAASDTWRICKSGDVDKRLVSCTAIIEAKGHGSQDRLADALDARCWAYSMKEKFNLAAADCEASIALKPNYSYAYNNLGTAYFGLGDYPRALVALNKAVALKPNYYWSRMNRAKTYVAIGNKEKAALDYKYLLETNPSSEEIRNALNDLAIRRPAESSSPAPNALSVQPQSSANLTIVMKREGGTYTVPVLVNDAITLDFVLDSGASDVSIPSDVFSTLIRTRTINESDFTGTQTYVLADGSKSKYPTFVIKSLKVGGAVIKNVNGSVTSSKGSLLLGQSFLEKFKSWSIENTKHELVLVPW